MVTALVSDTEGSCHCFFQSGPAKIIKISACNECKLPFLSLRPIDRQKLYDDGGGNELVKRFKLFKNLIYLFGYLFEYMKTNFVFWATQVRSWRSVVDLSCSAFEFWFEDFLMIQD